jgi:hypothetical protein
VQLEMELLATKAQRETEVQPHSVADDFGCKPVTGVEINLFVHPGNLPDFSLLGNLTVLKKETKR